MAKAAKKKSEASTRSRVRCPVFGDPKEFSQRVLPTHEEVILEFLFVQNSIKSGPLTCPPVATITKSVADKLIKIWNNEATIPTVTETRVIQKILKYYKKYKGLLKSYQQRKNSENFQKQMHNFREDAKKLFDIAACKCKFDVCSCDKFHKVPTCERTFLTDQRCARQMVIGSTDIQFTRKLSKRNKRKNNDSARHAIAKGENGQDESNKLWETMEISDNDSVDYKKNSGSDSETDSNSVNLRELVSAGPIQNLPDVSKKRYKRQMRFKLPTLARTADRFRVSDRAAAAIATSVLQDVGFVTPDDISNVIDKNKLRRQRQKARSELQNLQGSDTEVFGLYFDGRKDRTLILEKKGHKFHRNTITEEHISLVGEPKSKYLGHVTPNSGSAIDIASAILDFLTNGNINTEKIVAVGCDGTMTNIGHKGGVIRLLEEKLERAVQWFPCLLHANELPLRHLIAHLDGKTKGPYSFSGPIGQALENCQKLPVVQFQKIVIDEDLPEVNLHELSTDQKYLFEICKAIESGECSADLANKNPGKIAHSRWLTTANRVLRLYIATINPSESLKVLAEFIVKVYARVWFLIKTKPLCKDGAKHIWEMVKFSRYLPELLKNVIDPVIKRNAYFAHPENLLLCMVADDRGQIRELAVRRLLEARRMKLNCGGGGSDAIREFKTPELNFDAMDYTELIDWSKCPITDPPVLASISEEKLHSYLQTRRAGSDSEEEPQLIPLINYQKFPCHNQSVERCVKIVTEACSSVCGISNRDGFIRNRLYSRAIIPEFGHKSDYNPQLPNSRESFSTI